MTKDELTRLLPEAESLDLDWKMDFPPELAESRPQPEWDTGRARLLKSLVALANGDGPAHAHLIYGVKDLGTERQVHHISRSFDDADFQQWAENTFDPPPKFRYAEVRWDGSSVIGMFRIERTRDYPHVVQAGLGDILFKGQVWFRRGTKNTVALHSDLQRMFLDEKPFKIAGLDNPTFKAIEEHYQRQGSQLTHASFAERDSLLAQGYELATYPGTRREVWVGPRGRDHSDIILMLKPNRAS